MSISPTVKTLINLASVHTKLLRQQDQWLAAHGISYKEFLIMYHLQESPAGSLKRVDLAEKVGLSASGVTRLLNPMEKIGLVSKEDGARDARVSLVCLSEAGLGVFRDAMKSFDQRAQTFVESINAKQRQALNELSQVRL